MLDLAIHNGTVVDGTGSPGFRASVLVQDNQITVHRGAYGGIEAARTIDAAERVVCPGFVDLHSHAGLTILGEPHHDPKVRQGVTTELVGIDGISHAPFKNAAELRRAIWLDSGFNGYPPTSPDWLTVSDLYGKYDNAVAVNVAFILGNAAVRIWGVGWNDRPASPAEIENMRAVTREAMQEGAWGLSSGLDYPPGSFADTDELAALAEISAQYGGFYHTHTRAALRERALLAPWEEALEIGRRGGIPVHLTHYRQSRQGVGSHHDYLGLVERGREQGMDVTFDCYSYPYSGTTLLMLIPNWTMDGGPERAVAAFQDPRDRARIAREIDREPFAETWLTNFQQPHNKQYEGKSIVDVANLRNQDPVDAIMDLLVDENLSIHIVGTGTNPHTLAAFVSHPYGMIASDAILLGEYQNPRSYGCFPLVLAEFVRAEKHLRLPEAVRKMTSFPAQRLGLPDRGILRDGFKADIVIFDPNTVKTDATLSDPKRYPVGIDYVIVNGQVVIDDGENTGALPGRALRRGRPS